MSKLEFSHTVKVTAKKMEGSTSWDENDLEEETREQLDNLDSMDIFISDEEGEEVAFSTS